MDNKVAVLIDGAFVIKRYQTLYGSHPEPEEMAKAIVIASMNAMRKAHKRNGSRKELYRILFYDW